MSEVSITYKLYDFVTDSVTKIQKNIGTLNSTITKATAYFDDLGKRAFIFNQLAQASQSVNQQLSNLTQPALDFQQQLADLQALTGVTCKELDNLASASKKVGVSSGLGASQAIEAYKLLASNIDITTIGGVEGLKKLANETITLAQAAGVDLPTAANTMASAINQFQLSADEASRVINVLGAGAKYGAAEIPDLADSLKLAGTTAAQSGVNIEGTVGALEVLSQNAIKGSEAGTALRNIMLKMRKELGFDFTKISLSQALESLKPQLSDVTFLTKTFGLENVNAAQVLIANASAVDEMTQKVTGTNVAYEQAAIRTETYEQKMKRIRAAIDNVKISIVNATGPFLPFTQIFTEYFAGFSQLVPGLLLVKDAIIWVTNAQNLMNIATKAGALATKIFTAAQWLLNAAFVASPIGWIVLAIGALIAGIVIAWKKFAGFREVVMGLWQAFKQVFTNIGNFFKMIFTPIFKAIDAIKRGQWGEAAKQAGIALYNLTPVGMVANTVKFARQGGFTQGVSDAFERGKEQQRAKELAQKQSTNVSAPLAAAGNNTAYSTATSATSATSGNISSTPGVDVVAGSTNTKVFNITIHKMVEKLDVITNTIKESPEQIRDLITKTLMEAVNDANAVSL